MVVLGRTHARRRRVAFCRVSKNRGPTATKCEHSLPRVRAAPLGTAASVQIRATKRRIVGNTCGQNAWGSLRLLEQFLIECFQASIPITFALPIQRTRPARLPAGIPDPTCEDSVRFAQTIPPPIRSSREIATCTLTKAERVHRERERLILASSFNMGELVQPRSFEALGQRPKRIPVAPSQWRW